MEKDKYSAVWVSHSSIGDFLKCPRLYFLRNVYKNPKTGRKINMVTPSLSLGQAVHATVEALANYKAEERFVKPLIEKFELEWQTVSGKRGGFRNEDEETETKNRGAEMIRRIMRHPGPLANKTVKLPASHNDMPPNFYLSEDENVILCGKIDWLEYVPENESIRVIDFKTGKYDENEDSLQLPIYRLLLDALQKRKVSGAAYWYLDRNDEPTDVSLPNIPEAKETVLTNALKVKTARREKRFLCPQGKTGCFGCQPFEKIINGEAELVGVGEYNQEIYISK